MIKMVSYILAPVAALSFYTSSFAVEFPQGTLPPATATSRSKLIDINTASKSQLIATLGITEEDAARIISARPFMRKDELTTKKVLPADVYERVKKLVDAVC